MIVADTTSPPHRVLFQRREKAIDDTPYNGRFELPQGKVNRNESLEQAARRELLEETNLSLHGLLSGQESSYSERTWPTSHLLVSRPLICVVDTVQNHLGIAVVAAVQGAAGNTPEATQHQWLTFAEIAILLKEDLIFPLNVPMIEEFMRTSSWS